jgi:hypothetical protein
MVLRSPGWLARSWGGDRVVVGREQLDGARAAADPQPLADQAEGRRVVAALEDHVAIAVQHRLLPDRQVVRPARQRPQRRPFELLELLERALPGRAMLASAGHVAAPGAELGVQLVEWGRRSAGQEVALDVVDPALLDLPLQVRRPRWVGIDAGAVVLGALAVGALDQRVVHAGTQDGCLQIVQDDPLRHAAQHLEGVAVQEQPGPDALIEDHLGV